VDTKQLSLDPATGGARLVTLAVVADHRTYTGKDNQPRFITTLIYGGGNREISTPPDHPLYNKPVGDKVLMSEPFLENRFGWKAAGEPQLLELAGK
jgi:hypothetical protein